MATLSELDVASAVREVTDEEVDFYTEHGWVMLEGLVDPDLALELLDVAQRFQGEQLKNERMETSNSLGLRSDAEPYRAFALGEVMCRNAQRLINRKRLNDDDIAVRYQGDTFVCRLPSPPGTTRQGWHQDSPEHGSDRMGELKFWVALCDIPAEVGPMRFVDRSHWEGPLGSVLNADYASHENYRDLLDVYPKLTERITPPMEYKVGDATVHNGYTVHGTLPNTSGRPRLSHIFSYAPADIRWWDAKELKNWGADRVALDDEAHPIVYPRA